MKTTATNKKIRELISQLRDGSLQPRPDFQRRLVWSNKDKCKFIETVLLGYPFPEIYVAAGDVDVETGKAKEMLVDGQQRISTLLQYFQGFADIRLPKNLKPYSDLTKEEKENFLQYDVVVRDLGRVELILIREVFERINATRYSLNAMEIHNARYEGQYKNFAEDIAQKPFFDEHRIFSAGEIRRMEDTRYALFIITTIMSTYFNRDDEIEQFLQQYNDDFPMKHELERELDRVFGFIDSLDFSINSRIWKKNDLFTVIIELHRAFFKDRLNISQTIFKSHLSNFYGLVDTYSGEGDQNPDVAKYYKAALQATNDRSSRINRGEIIRKLIRQSLENTAA